MDLQGYSNEEKTFYSQAFSNFDAQRKGFLTAPEIAAVMKKSKLSEPVLAQVSLTFRSDLIQDLESH
jgi:hypothetical protein